MPTKAELALLVKAMEEQETKLRSEASDMRGTIKEQEEHLSKLRGEIVEREKHMYRLEGYIQRVLEDDAIREAKEAPPVPRPIEPRPGPLGLHIRHSGDDNFYPDIYGRREAKRDRPWWE